MGKMVPDIRPTWLRWLHRAGYVTTALVLAQLVLVGSILGREWMKDREREARMIERSRTHETALLPNDDQYVGPYALQILASLPSLNSLHGDGLRFVVMPSFGTADYGVALSLRQPSASNAEGLLLVVKKHEEGRPLIRHEFAVPIDDYRAFVTEMDALADGWPGGGEGCLDGSPAAFERVRGDRITSGMGNCSRHYKRMKLLVLNLVRRFAPGDDLPTEDDWHRYEPGD